MSHISTWNNRCSFMWAVERPLRNRTRFSPKFTVNHCEFYLKYFLSASSDYVIKIYGKVGAFPPFLVSVYVEGSNGCIIPSLCTSPKKISEFLQIWGPYTESTILKAVPDFLTDGLVKFHVVFSNCGEENYHFTLPPPISIKAVKSVQALAEPIQKEDKSIQTPMYIDGASCCECLAEDLSKLLDQGTHSDVVLVCGNRTVRAHKSVLCSRSKVFAGMLQGDLSEGHTDLLEIHDIDPAVFGNLLRYLYAADLPNLRSDSVRCLYEVAYKYEIASLARRCANFLQENLDPENACEMLTLADAHSDGEFKQVVMYYIIENGIHLQDDRWLPFCKRQPMLAVEVLNCSHKLIISSGKIELSNMYKNPQGPSDGSKS